MPAQPFLRIHPPGPVSLADLAAALNEALDRGLAPGSCRLEGPGALRLAWKTGMLTVECLTARAANGWRVHLLQSQSIPVPEVPPGQPQPVRLALEWNWQPVADGSSIEYRTPALGRLPLDVPIRADTLLVGWLSKDGFVEARPPADRLDSCPAWAHWTQEVDEHLEAIDGQWLRLLPHLGRSDQPHLAWAGLVPPVLARLADARSVLNPEGEPAVAVRRVRGFLTTLADLPIRACQLADADLVALLGQLPLEAVRPSLCHGEEDEAAMLTRCCARARQALSKLQMIIGPFAELYDVLYHQGRLFRKLRALPVSASPEQPGAREYLLSLEPLASGGALALLLEPSPVAAALGDVGVGPAEPRRPPTLLLGSPGPSGLHWIDRGLCARMCVTTAPRVRLRGAAVYVPLLDSAQSSQ